MCYGVIQTLDEGLEGMSLERPTIVANQCDAAGTAGWSASYNPGAPSLE
jgi:hypothetical protein